MGPGTKLSILPPREKRRRNFRSIGGGISQIVSRRKYRKVGENILPRLGGGRVWKKYSTTQAFRNSLAFLPPPNPSPQNGKIDFLLPLSSKIQLENFSPNQVSVTFIHFFPPSTKKVQETISGIKSPFLPPSVPCLKSSSTDHFSPRPPYPPSLPPSLLLDTNLIWGLM